jgi:hypothetical protein
MQSNKGRRQVYLLVILSLLMATLACRVEPPKIVMEENTPTPVVAVITQVITQIVSPTPAPTQPPTLVPTETLGPTLTPTWDPMSAPIYYPLEDCVASRLHIGDKAMVSYLGGANAIRYGTDTSNDTVLTYAQPGEILEIIGGPVCDWGLLVWMVRTRDGVVGFTPEGDGNEYWLIPAPPGS